jgi:prevent-host-death family protein
MTRVKRLLGECSRRLTLARIHVQLEMNLEGRVRSAIGAKELRASLPKVVEQVRKGARFTVIYRSRPAFRIVPVDESDEDLGPLEADPLFRAGPVGRSKDGRSAEEHDSVLYRS